MKSRSLARIPQLALAIFVLCAGCAGWKKVPSVPAHPAGGIKLPVEKVAERLGAWAFEFKLKHATLSPNEGYGVAVQQVFDAVLAQATAQRAGTFPAKWTVLVIQDEQIEATAFPGGGVLVTSGLMKFVDNDADKLALVLSHEISHVLGNHFAERLRAQAKLLEDVQAALASPSFSTQGFDPKTRALVFAVLGIADEITTVVPFAKEQESHADQAGIRLLACSQFKLDKAVAFWTELAAIQRKERWSLTHPSTKERTAALEQELPRLSRDCGPAPIATASR